VAGFTFVLLLAGVLWLPGRLLLAAAGRGDAPAWLAVPVSYALWLACWSAGVLAAAPVSAYESVWLTVVLVAGALAWRRRGGGGTRAPRANGPTLALFAALAAYLWWAGPYLEVPADAWWHLGEVRAFVTALGKAGAVLDPAWLGQDRAWYFLYAELCRWSGLALEHSTAWVAFAGGLAVLWCYHGFAVHVFSRARLGTVEPRLLAAVAVLFFLAHFGVSVFSWLRYYSFAPALLNLTVFLGAIALFTQALDAGRGWRGDLALAAGLGLAAFVAHRQEAIFAAVMAFIVLLAYVLVERMRGPATGTGRRARLVLAGVAVAGYAVAHLLAAAYVRRNSPELETAWLAPLSFPRDAFVVAPGGHVYQALTAWGLAVYLMFAWRWRRFAGSAYLLGGMLVPVVTLFNPLFVDLFLRFAYPEVLWRFVYLVPLSLVGAVLFVDAARELSGKAGRVAQLRGALACTALLALLLPWHTPLGDLPYSRFVTLGRVDVTNSARLWDDLYEELRRRPPGRVLTDPVTGYTLPALTGHRYRGFKFYVAPRYPLQSKHYAPRDFARYDGMLLVINRRNGRGSRAGRVSGHWPADVMRVSRYYSPELLEFVQANPALFRKTWERDRIAIYEIHTREPGAGA